VTVVRGNGINMHVVDQGQGAPIVMLHGFPDHGAAWRPLTDLLAPSFRTIAPDLRGYGESSRPAADEDYRIDVLLDDIDGLLDALDLRRACLCGHDWGGVLAFAFAQRRPQRVAALVAINSAPPDVLQAMIWHDPGQRAASQYISFLRSPEAAAVFNEANVDALMTRFLGEARTRGELSDGDWNAYRRAWSHPGVWRAMLAWYRAAPFDVPPVGADAPIVAAPARVPVDPPVLLIWGEKDTVFVPAMADAVAAACRDATVERLPDAGHVPHREAPELCADRIAAFIARHSIP
jgi:pimeloyl-ACP methyl ester carboxylesterase